MKKEASYGRKYDQIHSGDQKKNKLGRMAAAYTGMSEQRPACPKMWSAQEAIMLIWEKSVRYIWKNSS